MRKSIEVFIIITPEGIFIGDDLPKTVNSKWIIAKCEMPESEYNKIPATNESNEFFKKS